MWIYVGMDEYIHPWVWLCMSVYMFVFVHACVRGCVGGVYTSVTVSV